MKPLTGHLPPISNFRFPIAGWIILIHELLERFSFYGMKGILALYLNVYLGFDEDTSTIIYHLFTGFSYLSPIFGAIVADNYLGRYKTIVVIGLIYLTGHLLMPLTAIRKNTVGPLIGMCVLAIGAGGIKSSVAAFGGDQLPAGNDGMVEKFFSIFYTSINLGALIAQFVTPILRSDVECVDKFCYPLAFGVPAAAFFITYLIFLSGTRRYNIVPRSKNALSAFCCCVYTGTVRWLRNRKLKKYKTVLEYAKPDFTDDFINDCTVALRIMLIFTPIPVVWALYDQQGSRWTLQAKNMDGRIGSTYSMKPDQIQAFNSLFIIILIPVFDFIIYPVCDKLNMLKEPTSRLVTSYTVAAISFIVAGILQIYIVKGQSLNFSDSGSKLSIINSVEHCRLNVALNKTEVYLNFRQSLIYDVTKGIKAISLSCNSSSTFSSFVTFREQEMQSGVVYYDNQTSSLGIMLRNVTVQHQDGVGLIRSIFNDDNSKTKQVYIEAGESRFNITELYIPVPVGKYRIYCSNRQQCGNMDVVPGFVGSLCNSYQGKLLVFEEFKPRLIHMLWQLPQYILITGAEILCSITSLSFAYSEAPDSMKSLMQAVYLLTIFGGNILVVIVAAVGRQISQAMELFIFAALVLVAGFVNWVLIRKFWYSRKVTDSTL